MPRHRPLCRTLALTGLRQSEENARLRAALHSAREEAERMRRLNQAQRGAGGGGGEAKASEGQLPAAANRCEIARCLAPAARPSDPVAGSAGGPRG